MDTEARTASLAANRQAATDVAAGADNAGMIVLECGRTRVGVAPELGGRIAQIEVAVGGGWAPLLLDDAATPIEARDPYGWGCYLMAPWPNRIANGRFTFGGDEYRLTPNRDGHALHGLGVEREWFVYARGATWCALTLRLDTAPFHGAVRQWIEALDDGVRLSAEVRARDCEFPAGIGWHPWFRRNVMGAGDVRVRVDAGETYVLRDMIPTGEVAPVEGDLDLRLCPPLGGRRIDACYRGVRGPMRLAWDGLEFTMTSSPNLAHAVVYTPAHAACVEPQTCAIDAFNLDARGVSGTGVQVVGPGRPLRAETEWRWAGAG
jgi:aldose 1-epimerase